MARISVITNSSTFPNNPSTNNNGLTAAKPNGQHLRTEWCSILLGTWMAFISSVHFSLYFTSLWPFMKTLDPSATEAAFGIVVAAYSLSQIVASLLLGYWANRIERLRPPLMLCNLMMFCGNVFYFLVELFPIGAQKYVLIWARFITGAGSAQIGLLKAYVSAASTLEDRSRATAFVTGGVAIGLSMGPAFQIAFSWLSYPGLSLLPSDLLHLSMFNCPALFAAALNIVNAIIVKNVFREASVGVLQKKNRGKTEDAVDDQQKKQQMTKLPPPDQLALWLCYLLRFTQQFIITNLETIGSAFAMLMFLWSPKEVVFYESLAHLLRGLLAVMVYIVYIVFDLSKILSDRIVTIVSLGGFLLFHLLTYSWPFLPNDVPEVVIISNNNNTIGHNHNSTHQTMILGCDRTQHDWCDGLKQVNVYIYYVLMIGAIGSAFPMTNVSMNTLFSKAIGPRLQAKQQGIMMMCGGVGRMLGPLMIGFLFTYYGPRVIWVVECAVILFTGALWLLFYRRLVPLRVPPELINITTTQKTIPPNSNDNPKMAF